MRILLAAALLAALEAYLLSYLAWPIHLRPLITWLALAAAEGLGWSIWFNRLSLDLLKPWRTLNLQQRWILLALAAIGLLFFGLIIPPNMRGAETPHIFNVAVNDENVTYLPLQWMLKLSGKPEEWIYGLIVYEDYHYGYPFYFLSACVLLPARLFWGADFAQHTQANLLLLRLIISSLPILLSSILLVWMNTRFSSWWKSILLFLLILFIPNAVFYQIRFWHPDGLVVLAVVLTLFFLSRDHYRLGWNFFAAAVFCGLAAAIKLYGFFFFLSIPVYLSFCFFDGHVVWPKIINRAVLFVLAMGLCILLCNPFLGVPSARTRMLQIQNEKAAQLGQGYQQPGADDIYHVGLQSWLPSLEAGFGPAAFLGFLTASLVAGAVWGPRRLLNLLTLAWFMVISLYLINFSAVKSQHYWLPAMLPLYGSALNMADLSSTPNRVWLSIPAKLQSALKVAAILGVLWVMGINFNVVSSVFIETFR